MPLCSLAAETNLRRYSDHVWKKKNPISSSIDSIQTMWVIMSISAVQASVSQVRAARHELTKALPNGAA